MSFLIRSRLFETSHTPCIHVQTTSVCSWTINSLKLVCLCINKQFVCSVCWIGSVTQINWSVWSFHISPLEEFIPNALESTYDLFTTSLLEKSPVLWSGISILLFVWGIFCFLSRSTGWCLYHYHRIVLFWGLLSFRLLHLIDHHFIFLRICNHPSFYDILFHKTIYWLRRKYSPVCAHFLFYCCSDWCRLERIRGHREYYLQKCQLISCLKRLFDWPGQSWFNLDSILIQRRRNQFHHLLV